MLTIYFQPHQNSVLASQLYLETNPDGRQPDWKIFSRLVDIRFLRIKLRPNVYQNSQNEMEEAVDFVSAYSTKDVET